MLQKKPLIISKSEYILVRKNASMHYIIADPKKNNEPSNEQGTILLLQGYQKTIEDYQTSIQELTARGFFVIAPDFIGQGKSDREPSDKLGGYIKDYRNIIDDLNNLLNKVILKQLPAPYYILADDMGATFALIAHDVFATTIKRQVLVSPLLTPNNHYSNSLFHYYCHIMSDISLGHVRSSNLLTAYNNIKSTFKNKNLTTKIINEPRYCKPSLGWYATILDGISNILSNKYIDKMIIPTLVYLPIQDDTTHSSISRQFISRLRMAQYINLHGAPHDILASEDKYTKQFWRGFFSFIPGKAHAINLHKK